MKKNSLASLLLHWGPAILVMIAIFRFSALPSDEIPQLGSADTLLKKLGHMTGYALLSLSLIRGLGKWNRREILLALLFCFLYAITDEFHQRFVPGRSGRFLDVLIDTSGALLALWAAQAIRLLRQIVFWQPSLH